MSNWLKKACLVLTLGLAGTGAGAEVDKPVVGFLQGDARGYQTEFLRKSKFGTRVLAPNGFRFALGDLRHVFTDREELSEQSTYHTLRQFHVMVLGTPNHGITVLNDFIRRNAEAAGRAIEQYIREGGSVLILTESTRYPGTEVQEYASVMYKPLGLELLREGVWDPEHHFEAPVFQGRPAEGFLYTENIVKDHPVTQGVARLALPRESYGPGVIGLRLAAEWQVLVRGEASAQSHRRLPQAYDLDLTQTATYASAPPLAAVRTLGKGRVMVCSMPRIHAYLNVGTPGWKMIAEETGWAEKNLPSHGGRLLLNGLRWLAETAVQNPKIGDFPFAEFAYQPVTFPATVQHDDQEFAPPVETGVRGVIGARTALSSGSGTVADYAAAARAAGLSFVVFTEALEQLTAAEFEQLKADCRAVSNDTFYAVPGLEFSDHLDNRWALWADRLTYPPATVIVRNSAVPMTQWDGRRIHQLGAFLGQDERPPATLLTYRHLREKGGHPHNMWWFFRVAPFVHDPDGKLAEDNREEFLYALRDLKRVEPVSYTRMAAPADVARAAQTMVTVARDRESLREWMNTRNKTGSLTAASVYLADRGAQVRISQWAAINSQVHYHYNDVRGVQRARLSFRVDSEAGIKEVRVRDANLGVVRRFSGHGEKQLAREFEMVHDRDYYLVLEAEDQGGATALSSAIYIYCYKDGIRRCGDNHNFLGRFLWHSCYDQMLNFGATGGGFLNSTWSGEAVDGYDTSAPWRLDSTFSFGHHRDGDLTIDTVELPDYPSRHVHGGGQRKVLDVLLPGRDPIILAMDIGDLVERHGTPERPSPVMAGLPVTVGENKLFHRVHRAYYFQNRTNMFIVYDHRRPDEGTAACRGNVIWHEGEITFKRDATLAGEIPIELAGANVGGEAATHILAKGPDGFHAIPLAENADRQPRPLAAGGYVTVVPNNTFDVVYVPRDSAMSYTVTSRKGRAYSLGLGLGTAGQTVRAGQTLPYRFAVVTLGSATAAFKSIPDYGAWLDEVGDSFGLGGRGGVKATVKVGKMVDAEMFFTLDAADNEVLLDVTPRDVIIAQPFRVKGLQNNGAVAVWSSQRPWLRFVGMMGGEAYFQEKLDAGGTIWAGNVLLCDQAKVILTVVAEGQAAGKSPFVELHNPTDQPIDARVWSPQNTPVFGGLSFTKRIPAGASVRHEIALAK